MAVPEVYWSESAGLLRVVGNEIRGPRGVLEEFPDDVVRLVPVVVDPCAECGCTRNAHEGGVGKCAECGECREWWRT